MTARDKLVLWFSQIDKEDGGMVGGKGANLGEMTKSGFPVPEGFVITAQAYFLMIKENHLEDKIKDLLKGIDPEDSKELNRVSAAIKRLIERVKVPEELEKAIYEAYEKLGKGKDIYVAVRSSATAEDLPEASFAGQQETFLNVKGDTSLIEHVRKAWASLFEPRAIYYRERQGFDHFKVGIALPVQRMVQSDVSGIMFTINPMNNDKTKIVIEAIWGLGEKIVQGAITPDHYQVDRHSLEITESNITPQKIEMIKKGDRNIDAKVPKSRITKKKMTDKEIVELATIGKKLHQHYFWPQDIEWALENGKIYIVQTRPITTIKKTEERLEEKKTETKKITGKLILKGDPASPGLVTGVVNIVKSAREIHKVKSGDILVTDMTTPDFVPAMKKAVAIVTNKGGQTSHAAIVSRELGVPCVVGTDSATRTLKHGMVITVNGSTGEIYLTNLKPSSVNFNPQQDKKPFHAPETRDIKTATKVYVNLGEPDLAEEMAQRHVDGVGLLRAEFMIAQIGTHPRKLIKEKKQKLFIDKLADGLETFAKAFSPRPIIYRATDFKTNEYRNLVGGKDYEPNEPNPMLGFRGAFRYHADPEVFELELAAIKKVRNQKGLKNLHLMIPFVRSVEEMRNIKKIVVANGLSRSASFKLLMMVEIPVNVIMLDEFIDVGIDGVSIGTNDLTMLILGTDRDNSEVAPAYDERNPAVLWALKHIVTTCARRGVTSSICGQAPSVYPEITEHLVKWGVTSVSVSPDMIEKTRIIVAEAERKLTKHA